ncbi:MAG: ribosome silencing factor [candidate division Zixibacteria bacterium]|nr:ribosome silencing factor [candidate division Zixibacteria bacterium]
MTSLALARAAGKLASSKKAFDIKILNLKEISSVCDYFIICTGSVDVHVKAIANAIERGLRDDGIRSSHREGMEGASWVLLDYFDVIVHVFTEDARQFYALEKLWGDAPVEDIE